MRATPDARVSMPLHWDEVRAVRPEDWTLTTAAERYAAGDPWAGMDGEGGSLDGLLALAEQLGPVEKPPKGTGRRTQTMPLVEVARARTKAQALAGVRVGQPVKCVRLADGRWGATLRIGLAMGQVTDAAGLDDAALAARFETDMATIREALLACL